MSKRLAAGFRGFQSTGGKDPCQNRGLGWANSTPTSGRPFCPGLMSMTVHTNSSFVTMLWIFSICPVTTGSHKSMSPPCAFTTAVFALSVNVSLLALLGHKNGNRRQYPLAPALIRNNPRLGVGRAHGDYPLFSAYRLAFAIRREISQNVDFPRN